jgi:DNA-binding response OmpR family regulator
VLSAFSGRSGIDLICVAQPDVAIIDLVMPDIDGFDVVRAVKEASGLEKCTFRALTGRTDLNARQLATAVGVSRFFTKGSDISHLLSCVAQHASVIAN